MDEEFDFTELGERLRGPEGAAVAAGAIERLDELRAAAEARLTQGLAPADYAANRTLLEALAASRRVMVTFRTLSASGSGGGSSSPGHKGD